MNYNKGPGFQAHTRCQSTCYNQHPKLERNSQTCNTQDTKPYQCGTKHYQRKQDNDMTTHLLEVQSRMATTSNKVPQQSPIYHYMTDLKTCTAIAQKNLIIGFLTLKNLQY